MDLNSKLNFKQGEQGESSSKIVSILIVVVIVFLILFVVVIGYNKYSKSKNSNKKEAELVQKEIEKSNKYIKSEKFVEDVKEKTFDDIKKEKPLIASNPNISSKEAKDKLEDSSVIKKEKEKHVIVYNGESIVPNKITIAQGDVVIFKNTSTNSVRFSGDGWGNRIPLGKDKTYTQEFDFKGEYNYSVIVNDNNLEGTVTGVVVVEQVNKYEQAKNNRNGCRRNY